jgi:ParB-like chromosome segregation protein Spo0J
MSAAWTISLDLIDRDPRGWPRLGLNLGRVTEFAHAYADGGLEALDPVEVVALPNERWLLVNGRHRLAARERLGASEVLALTVDAGDQDPVEFAFEYGLADAARSPLPLTRPERQQALARLLREHPDRTDVAIAALVGVSTKTVQRARRTDADDAATSPPPGVGSVRVARPDDVARALARQLDRLWDARTLSMSLGLSDTTKLGDALGEALINQFGAAAAITWTERLSTWATRAHTVAVAAEQAEQ